MTVARSGLLEALPPRARCPATRRAPAGAASPGIASGPAHVQVAQRFEFQDAASRRPMNAAPARAKRAVDEEIVGLVERDGEGDPRDFRHPPGDARRSGTGRAGATAPESRAKRRSGLESGGGRQRGATGGAARRGRSAERAADLRDLGRRVLARLCGVEAPREPERPYILVMDEVGPPMSPRLDASGSPAELTARGGATPHQRDHRPRPRHSGIGRRRRGRVLGPGAGHSTAAGWRARLAAGGAEHQTVAAGRRRLTPCQQRQARADAQRLEPARTRDGPVEVCANLGDTADAARARWSFGRRGRLACCAPRFVSNNAHSADLATQKRNTVGCSTALGRMSAGGGTLGCRRGQARLPYPGRFPTKKPIWAAR
ncbi:hypothetical protein ACPA9J_16505 [Pseudomonas aeruginosa]